MATIQTRFFTGQGRPVLGNQFRSGSPIMIRHTHTFTTTVLAADVLELFEVPPYARLFSFRCITANVGAVNAVIGVMTGTPGDVVAVRTVNDALIATAALNTSLTSTLLQLETLGKNGDSPYSIGLDPAGDITAAANKTITFEAVLF